MLFPSIFPVLSFLTVDEHSQMAGWEGKQIPYLFLSHPPSKYESQSASEYQENESNTIHNICLTAATGHIHFSGCIPSREPPNIWLQKVCGLPKSSSLKHPK